MVRECGGSVRVIEPGKNLGIAGRNVGAAEARGDLLLFLDDDAYPLPGAVEELVRFMDTYPRVAAAGGLVRDVDAEERVLLESGFGTFDWWLRAGDDGPCPPEGFPAFFFPEGASMVRRSAF